MDDQREAFKQKADQLFSYLDLNHDSTLSLDELQKGFEKLNIPAAMREDLLHKMHYHKQQGITRERFEDYIEQQYLKIKELFNRIDYTKDQRANLEELLQGVKELYPDCEVSASTIEELFNMVDRSQDGTISFDEWCDFLIVMPKLSIQGIIKYWQTVLTISDPHIFSLYGLKGFTPPPKTIATEHERKSWFTSLGSGLIAGIFARTGTAPFDRLKLINQVHYKGSNKPPGLISGLTQIYKRDGFKGLFRGNFATILKTGPETSIKLTIFEKQKDFFAERNGGKLRLRDLFVAGAVSGLVANILTFPLGVIKIRIATAPSGTYDGIIDTVQKMAKAEGPIRPFFRGMVPALTSIVPNSGLNLMSYEALKKILIVSDPNKEPSSGVFMIIGGLSGLFASTLLYPFQIVTSRIIMQGLLDKEQPKGMIQVAKNIYKSEGVRGYYKGYQASITRIILENALSYGCFEFMKKFVGGNKKKEYKMV